MQTMKKLIFYHTIIQSPIVVFCVAMGLRLLVLCVTQLPHDELKKGDASEYLELGKNLIQVHQFAVSNSSGYQPNLHRTPGYPLYVALHQLFFSDPLIPLYLSQSLLTSLLCLICYSLAKKLNCSVPIIAAWIIAIDPALIHFSLTPLSDSLLVFMIGLGIYTLFRWKETGSMLWFVSSALSLSLSAWTKPIGMFLWIFMLPFFWFVGGPVKTRLFRMALWTLLFTLPIGLWIARNDYVAQAPLFSTITGINTYSYRAAGVKAKLENISVLEAQRLLNEEADRFALAHHPTDYEMDIFFRTKGMDYIMSHPFIYTQVQVNGMLCALFGPSFRYILWRAGFPQSGLGLLSGLHSGTFRSQLKQLITKGILPILVAGGECFYLLILYILAIYAIYHFRKRPRWLFYLLIALFLYFLGLAGGPEAGARLRIPLMPMMAALSTCGIDSLLQSWKRNIQKLFPAEMVGDSTSAK